MLHRHVRRGRKFATFRLVRKRFQRWLHALQLHAKAWWYPPLIGALAFADLFLLVIPTDVLLVSAVMLAPRRWFFVGVTVAFGSALGCAALSLVLQKHGLPFLLHLSPGLEHTAAWAWTAVKMRDWGSWGVFLVAVSPMPQHPAIALAAISGMAIPPIFLYVFAGRAVKYLLIAWLSSHAPHLLGKLWVVRREMHDAGFDEMIEKPKS